MKLPNTDQDRPNVVWFRQDLRLADNQAFSHACARGAVLPVYILDDQGESGWPMGAASRVWLHHSLEALNQSLQGNLVLLTGDPAALLPRLAGPKGAVFWNRCYEPRQRQEQDAVMSALHGAGIDCESFKAGLLLEPGETLKKDGLPYKVFTPFRNKFYSDPDLPPPVKAPPNPCYATPAIKGVPLEQLGLLPAAPRWDKKFGRYWQQGEQAAQDRLRDFLDDGLDGYAKGRDRPDMDNVSRLSPHLHWGEISPLQVWHAVRQRMMAEGLEEDGRRFLNELTWREFSASLLYNFPQLPDQAFNPRFSSFPWLKNADAMQRWQKGLTGYPIVDAGMRQMWETGYMHNRVRMITGSFLVKDLLLPWQDGQAWFWDCLVDADLANNSASWQWVAGCGADAAPYFRIFNPVGQGRKFDPDGSYVRQWVPELSRMPGQYIHAPWEAPDDILENAGVRLGQNYPRPVVHHDEARLAALDLYRGLKRA